MATSNKNPVEKPRIIDGGLSIDDRGQVAFANDFDFRGIKRFYLVSNHKAGFVRAWHGHKKEAKYVLVVKGAALVGAVAINDWQSPSQTAEVHRHVLSEKIPRLVYIPPGYANGFKSLSDDTQLIFFSTFTMEQTLNDSVNYSADYWDIWTIEER